MAKKKGPSTKRNSGLANKNAASVSRKSAAKRKPPRDDFVPLPVLPEQPVIRVMELSPDVLFARAKYALQELLPQLQEDRRIDFVDVGFKITRGSRQSDLALRIHVKEKSNTNPIPTSCYHGRIRTDVIRSRFILAVSEIDSGDGIVSMGGTGTMSMGVRMPGTNENNRWMFLTCAHVVSQNQTPIINTDVTNTSGENVGRLLDVGSTYYEWSEDIDAAIFASHRDIPPAERGRFDHMDIRPTTIADPTPHDVTNSVRVFKYGNATKRTVGLIDSRKPLFRDIPIENHNGDSILTRDHFLVDSVDPNKPFALPGDSGAAVITEDGRLIGIVRGVTSKQSDSQRAVITPMSRIAGRFGFDVISE